MQHFILRCEHCQKEYTYCTYGNGPYYGTEEGCSMHYCAECQKAIDEALGKITKKDEPRWLKINEPLLLPLFETIKKKQEEKKMLERINGFPMVMKCHACIYGAKYDNRDTITHDGIKYMIEWDNDNPEDKQIYISMDYDLINNKFTDIPWKYDKTGDEYVHESLEKRTWGEIMEEKYGEGSMDLKNITPMSAPSSKFLFMDFPYMEKSIVAPNEPIKLKHNLRTYSFEYTGREIKSWFKNGRFETVSKVKNNIQVDNLIDFITYKCYFEKYEDEREEYLVKIECV